MSQVFSFQPYSKVSLWLCQQKANKKSYIDIALSKLSLLFIQTLKLEPTATAALYQYLNQLASLEGQIKKDIEALLIAKKDFIHEGFSPVKQSLAFNYQASVFSAVYLCRVLQQFDLLNMHFEQCFAHNVFKNKRFITNKANFHKKQFQKWLGHLINYRYQASDELTPSQKEQVQRALTSRNIMPQLDTEKFKNLLTKYGEKYDKSK